MERALREVRTERKPRSRAFPWVVFCVVLAATSVGVVLRWNSLRSEHDLIGDLSSDGFSGEISEIRSGLDVEQQKLRLLIEGIAAAVGDEPSVGELTTVVSSLPIDDLTPAVTSVAVLDRVGSAGKVAVAVAADGSELSRAVGTVIGGAEEFGRALLSSVALDVPRVALVDIGGGQEYGLTIPVPGPADRSILVTLAASEFLTGALGVHDGVTPSLVPPDPRASGVAAADLLSDAPQFAEGQIAIEGGLIGWDGPVSVFGSDWTLTATSSADRLVSHTSNEPYLIAAMGLTLAVALLLLIRHRQRRISAEDAAVAVIAQSNRRFSTGFDNALIGMAILDASGRIVRANETMAVQLGRPIGDLEQCRLEDFVHPGDQSGQRAMAEALSKGDTVSLHGDLRYVRADGTTVWASHSVSALNRRTDSERQFLVQSLDTSHRRAAEDELRYQARHDHLTGLANRTHLLEFLGTALTECHADGAGISLMFIDLDLFKVVNDSLGHSSGDEVIQILADRLRVVSDQEHLLARFSGDEFVLACPRVTKRDQLERISAVIHREVGRQIELQDNPVHVTASIGVTIGAAESDTPESMLRDADAAMYRAKDLGRSRTEFFESGIRVAAVNRLDLEQRLRQAIEADSFTIHYQPVVDLKSGHVVGFEALLRWEHPELGLLLPGQFLGVADEAGLLDAIDRLTLGRACRQFAEWSERSEVAAGWHLAVNCTSRWFHEGVVSDILLDLLAESSLDPSRLWLEVTENALLRDTRATAASFDDLHALGVKVAIDDFGTGFNSLSYLSQFNVDRLKIDQSFVQSLGTSAADNAIVAAVVEMAGALGISSVAEGTESPAQLQILRDLGADLAQGFLLSRPLSSSQVESALMGID